MRAVTCAVGAGRRYVWATPHTVCTSTPWVWGPQDTLGKGVGLWPEAKVYLIKVGSEVWAIGNTEGKGVEVKRIAKV